MQNGTWQIKIDDSNTPDQRSIGKWITFTDLKSYHAACDELEYQIGDIRWKINDDWDEWCCCVTFMIRLQNPDGDDFYCFHQRDQIGAFDDDIELLLKLPPEFVIKNCESGLIEDIEIIQSSPDDREFDFRGLHLNGFCSEDDARLLKYRAELAMHRLEIVDFNSGCETEMKRLFNQLKSILECHDPAVYDALISWWEEIFSDVYENFDARGIDIPNEIGDFRHHFVTAVL